MNPEHIIPQILLRSWPFPRGSGRLTDKLFRNLAFAASPAIVRTTDGFFLKVMPNELIGRHLYLTGEFDRSIPEILCDFAEDGDTLLDIGANVGYVSACFLANIANSKVIAVEPQPDILDLLRGNLAAFHDRHSIYGYALSDADSEAFFEIDTLNRGMSRLGSRGVRVETRTANRLFDECSIDKLDIVKVDVEGHEEQVFSSCYPFLERLRPRAILFEDQGTKAAGDLGEMLRSLGYVIYAVRKRLMKLCLVEVVSSANCSTNDYLAVSSHHPLSVTARTKYRL